MATFYVLPSRHLLGQRYSEMLTSMFPDLRHTPWDWPDFAESLAAFVEGQGDVYLVYREDLDETMSVKDSLVHHFGAELDDEIVEVHFGHGLHQIMHQRWSTEPVRKAA